MISQSSISVAKALILIAALLFASSLIGCVRASAPNSYPTAKLNYPDYAPRTTARKPSTSSWCVTTNGQMTRKNTKACLSDGGKTFSSMSAAKRYASSGQLDEDDKVRSGREQPSSGPLELSSTGSGFFVSDDGHVVTNFHVIEGCRQVDIVDDARVYADAELIGSDKNVDLAIIRTSAKPRAVATFRSSGSVRRGADVIAVGYPLASILGTQVKVTRGIVNSTVGINNNINELQISAQVQPGNSGGPLVDDTGKIVGVVVGKLNEIKLAAATGNMAQDVNFAIKGLTAKAALDAFDVAYKTSSRSKVLRTVEIADEAAKYTVLIRCMN